MKNKKREYRAITLFTGQPTTKATTNRSGVNVRTNVRAHLLRKNFSRNFSSIRSGPLLLMLYSRIIL